MKSLNKTRKRQADKIPTRSRNPVVLESDEAAVAGTGGDLIASEQLLSGLLAVQHVGTAYAEDEKLLWVDGPMQAMFGFTSEEDYYGKSLQAMYASDAEYERDKKIIYEELMWGKAAEAEAELRRKDGSTFDGHVRVCVTDTSKPMKSTVIRVTDVSAQRAMAAGLREVIADLKPRTGQRVTDRRFEVEKFHALYDLAVAMTAEHTLDENLSLVVETGRNLLGTDTCFVALRDEHAGDVYMRTLSGIKTQAFRKMRIPLGAGLGGKVAASGKGYIIEDYYREIEPLLHDIVRGEGLISGVVVPIQIGQKNLGVLYAVNRSKTIFSESDLATLTLLGNLAAVEITSKRNLDEILKGRQELEGRVEERTAELSRTNQQLSREIVERKRVETTLTNQLLFFQSLIDTIPSPIYYKNAEGKYMGCNKAYEVYRGVTRNELIGKTLSDILPPEHAKKRLAKDAELFANPGVQIYEDKDIHSDGTFHDFIFNKATFYNTDGTVAGLAGVIIDITARKRAEMDLRGSEERFRAVFETAQDCIFIKSPDLRYTHVNPSMLRMLEMPHAAVIGLTDEEIFGEKQAKNLRDIDLRVLNGQIIEEQHSITLENNRIVFNCIRVPIRNAAGQITGLCGIARDVTERTELSVESEVQDYECRSRAMRATLAKARLAARSESIILLLGESGSGKDYLARFIHDCSNRASGPFFTINCAALPPELAESELFGHEPGAFTGAQGRKRGLLELAEGGTLLLNEIGELSPHLQAKLLTFLDTKTFTRVGGEKNISVNARLIAATNRNLEKEVKAGRFREDLYYRLDVFSIEVPPLRKRLDDLPILAAEILRELAKKMGLDEAPSIELHALRDLAAYHWPGNIRELRNVLERALILCDKKRIKLGDLAVNAKIKPAEEGAEWSLTVHFPHKETLNEVTMDLKRHLVIEALQRSGGSRKGAAELLGITADALKHYMRVFNLYR